jgi:hypothetical protein
VAQAVSRAAAPWWLLLVHQLPPQPTNVRVRVWRRLHDVGAIAIKNSVSVLPETDQTREDFEWIKAEIRELRGEAAVFAATSLDAFTNDEVIAAFRDARAGDYASLAPDAETLAADAGKRDRKLSAERGGTRLKGSRYICLLIVRRQ